MRYFTLSLLLCATTTAAAQSSKWKEIGKTSVGNSVFVDPHTVKKANGIVTARVRVKFNDPVKTAEGSWKSSQTVAMFDCAQSKVAVKENTYYADDAGTKVIEHNVSKIPGYGVVFAGSMTQIALDYLCKK